MAQGTEFAERRTSVDEIFEHLHEKISKLQLKPGDRISEAEIAAQFGVSRQPVRDAFSRLANADLLLIRPQRATEVRRFSMRRIEKSRFVRTAIEKEVLSRASTLCDEKGASQLDASLKRQDDCVAKGNFEAFGPLDYEFHRILCGIARADYAFEVIMAEKAKVDRLCMLAHVKEQQMSTLVEDHRAIAKAVKDHQGEAAMAAGMVHLARLDETIQRIRATNVNYFEPTDE